MTPVKEELLSIIPSMIVIVIGSLMIVLAPYHDGELAFKIAESGDRLIAAGVGGAVFSRVKS